MKHVSTKEIFMSELKREYDVAIFEAEMLSQKELLDDYAYLRVIELKYNTLVKDIKKLIDEPFDEQQITYAYSCCKKINQLNKLLDKFNEGKKYE